MAAERSREPILSCRKNKVTNQSTIDRLCVCACLLLLHNTHPCATLAQPNRRGCCCWPVLRRGGFRRRVVRTVVQPSSSTAVELAFAFN